MAEIQIFTELIEKHASDFYKRIAREIRDLANRGVDAKWVLAGNPAAVGEFCQDALSLRIDKPDPNQPIPELRHGLVSATGTYDGVPFETIAFRRTVPSSVHIGHAMHWMAAYRPGATLNAWASPGGSFEAELIAQSVAWLRQEREALWAAHLPSTLVPAEGTPTIIRLDPGVPAHQLSGVVIRTGTALAFGGAMAHPATPNHEGLLYSVPYASPGIIQARVATGDKMRVTQPVPRVAVQRLQALAAPNDWPRRISGLGVLTAVHASHVPYLAACYESLRDQTLPPVPIAWCIAFDGDEGSAAFAEAQAVVEHVRARGEIEVSFTATGSQSGPAAAKNVALEAAPYDVSVFIDADDFLERGALKKIVTALNMYPEAGWLLGRTITWRPEQAQDPEKLLRDTKGRRHNVIVGPGELNNWPDHKKNLEEQLNLAEGERAGSSHADSRHYRREHLLAARTPLLRALGGQAALQTEEDYLLAYRLSEVAPGIIAEYPMMAYRQHPLQTTQQRSDLFPLAKVADLARDTAEQLTALVGGSQAPVLYRPVDHARPRATFGEPDRGTRHAANAWLDAMEATPALQGGSVDSQAVPPAAGGTTPAEDVISGKDNVAPDAEALRSATIALTGLDTPQPATGAPRLTVEKASGIHGRHHQRATQPERDAEPQLGPGLKDD